MLLTGLSLKGAIAFFLCEDVHHAAIFQYIDNFLEATYHSKRGNPLFLEKKTPTTTTKTNGDTPCGIFLAKIEKVNLIYQH